MNRSEAISKLLEVMKSSEICATLVSSSASIRYYSGFTGSSAMLLILSDKKYLITDFRYIEQANAESPLFEVIDAPGEKALEFLVSVITEFELKKIWFEEEHISYKMYRQISEKLTDAELISANGHISKVRIVKSDYEISCMRKAAYIADKCFTHIQSIIKPRITEIEIATEIEFYLKRNHNAKTSFDVIVASGENAALPHAQPSGRLITTKDSVVLDFGSVVEGYCSDMTRTVIMEDSDGELFKIYRIVLEAQEKALKAIKSGVTGKEIDFLAREYITEQGYGKHFGHGLGHGVGLNIHEEPRLSEKSIDILEEGMIVTVEPGIYLPGLGGVRIEDMVLVTKDGIDNLTSSYKTIY